MRAKTFPIFPIGERIEFECNTKQQLRRGVLRGKKFPKGSPRFPNLLRNRYFIEALRLK